MTTSVNKVVKFLLDNRALRVSDDTMSDIYDTRLRVVTPLANIYEHLSKSPARKIFTGIYPNVGRNTISVPDLLTLSSITIDLAALPHADPLKGFPEYKDKIIINLGGLIKPTGQGDKVFVADSHEMQSLFVRGALCRSFYTLEDGRGWLSPSLAKFIIESYSIVLSAQIANIFSLNITEQLNAATFFALYMAKQLYGSNYGVPTTFYLCNFLGDKKYLEDIIKTNEASITGQFSISTACDLVAMNGPERMRSFDIRMLNQACANLGHDNISNLIAVEYPPYWVHQVILAMSGGKSSILYKLKQHRLIDRAKSFLQDLNTSNTFIGKLEDL